MQANFEILKWKRFLRENDMAMFVVQRAKSGRLVLVGTVLISVLTAWPMIAAAKPKDITNEEMALIPRYCPYTQSFPLRNTPERGVWEARIGAGFLSHLHHYCWALVAMMRAERPSMSEGERSRYRGEAAGDLSYVVEAIGLNPKFVLMPEILTKQGEVALRRRGDPDRVNTASKSFAQARALRPDYWPAYASWAEFLMYSGKKSEAKALVESGLQYSPTSKVLLELHRVLGGRPSDVRSGTRQQERSTAERRLPTLSEEEEPAPDPSADLVGETGGR